MASFHCVARVTGGETLTGSVLGGVRAGNKTCIVSASRPPYPGAGILKVESGEWEWRQQGGCGKTGMEGGLGNEHRLSMPSIFLRSLVCHPLAIPFFLNNLLKRFGMSCEGTSQGRWREGKNNINPNQNPYMLGE